MGWECACCCGNRRFEGSWVGRDSTCGWNEVASAEGDMGTWLEDHVESFGLNPKNKRKPLKSWRGSVCKDPICIKDISGCSEEGSDKGCLKTGLQAMESGRWWIKEIDQN